MGLFETLFGRWRGQKAIDGYFKTLTSYTPTFTNYSGGIYEAQTTRAAINAFATQCSKLKPEVIGGNEKLRKLFANKPNPWQTTSQFLYRVATILAVNNTAFILPMWDDYHTEIVGFYPLLPEQCTVVESGGKPWLKYKFATGNTAAVPMEEVAVLTNYQYDDDFFGASNRALLPTLQLIHTQDQGIIEGIKASATVRFMAKLLNILAPEDIDEERKQFTKSNLSSDNNNGVMMFDGKYADVKQIDSKPFVVDAEQMRLINSRIYDAFGCNEKILHNDWDEQTYTSYYEGKIEPFAIQLAEVLTAICYSERERAFGNAIMFTSNRLQYASSKSKLDITVALVDRGLMTRNEAREIWQLTPIEGGDDFVIRGEYKSDDDVTNTGGDNDGQS